MTTFPNSPPVLKGAIVGVDPFNPLASVIIFQYNPDTMTRTLTANAGSSGGSQAQGEALRLKGPPKETISFSAEIDAADQLEKVDALATTVGLYPTLASLEMLLYPKSALMIANEVLARVGVIEVIPLEAPLTLLIWGIQRVVPVKLTSFSITEEAYDTKLNPIRAKVALGFQVLTYMDLGLASTGGAIFLGHQVMKEVLATIGGVSSIAGAASGSIHIG